MRESSVTVNGPVNGVDCLGAVDIVVITAAGELSMIGSFRNKALRDLFMHGKAAKIPPKLRQRCLTRLDSLDAAKSLKSLDLPGFRLHGLQGKPKRYSLWVNGPWRITFEWVDGNAERVDLEQYH